MLEVDMTIPQRREKKSLKASLKRSLKFQHHHKADVYFPHRPVSFVRTGTVLIYGRLL